MRLAIARGDRRDRPCTHRKSQRGDHPPFRIKERASLDGVFWAVLAWVRRTSWRAQGGRVKNDRAVGDEATTIAERKDLKRAHV